MWMQKLAETYDNSKSVVGVETDDNKTPLLPICHTTQKTHIEIAIDSNGDFRRAEASLKKIFIPCTESSAGRTSGPVPHPLCDKLQYVALDYVKHGGDKKPHAALYISQLERWCDSNFSHPKAIAILKYAQKGNIIGDLIDHKILFAEADGKLLRKWDGDKKDKPAIFILLQNQEWQGDIFVRWVVESKELESATWKDGTLWKSWIEYYLDVKKEKKAFCLINGKELIVADQHPRRIRNEADGAKLISSGKTRDSKGKETIDDGCGFTFLGRFLSPDQASSVSLDASQKAHLALKWLIERQGYRDQEGQAIVAWATSGKPIPQPTDGGQSLIWGDMPTEEDSNSYTAQELGVKLRNRIAGYGKELGNTDEVVVMALDSATTGRMAITYYRDLTGSDYLKRIDDWHESCAWRHTYFYVQEKDDKGKTKNRYIPFVGAPAPADIAEAAYASNRNGKFEVDKKLRKSTIARLLPCIVDGQPIPRDIVESAVRRASNRIALENWQWNKVLTITCSLFRKFKQGKEKYEMSLDETRKTRDYLYGRLLAIADVLEERALFNAEKNRPTNAARYMQIFSQRPFRTWQQIHDLLTPYIMRLGGKAYFYKNLIAEVKGMFDPDEFIRDKPLTGEYLLGYYCQRQELVTKKDKPSSDEDEGNDENSEE
ncbi:MAG: type I-C CRISPR-associated protein Cas8c/Csd1 [Anaerolineales bacterium]|nr:MAG: type I-C CRISPR-associated protein Cas8c/Csd1 [Anaerolineales bacterium]